jgi:hypothetical protein
VGREGSARDKGVTVERALLDEGIKCEAVQNQLICIFCPG